MAVEAQERRLIEQEITEVTENDEEITSELPL